jgi:hypothetical protein
MSSQDEPDLVRRRRERLRALLAATDPPLPALAFPAERIARSARRHAVRRWRAAAAIALVALSAVVVRPVRAWIVGAARGLWSAAVGTVATRAAPRGDVVAPGAGSVSFTPPAGAFLLQVACRQRAGTLTIETVAGDSATAAASGGHGAAELVVLPRGLRIVNDSGGTASFFVRLPASLAQVEVRVGEEAPQAMTPAAAGQRWIVPLADVR